MTDTQPGSLIPMVDPSLETPATVERAKDTFRRLPNRKASEPAGAENETGPQVAAWAPEIGDDIEDRRTGSVATIAAVSDRPTVFLRFKGSGLTSVLPLPALRRNYRPIEVRPHAATRPDPPASLFIGPSPVPFDAEPDAQEVMYRNEDGSIEVVDLPDTPGGRALWHHLAATLRTVTAEEDAP